MPTRSKEPARQPWLKRLKAYVRELRELTSVYDGGPAAPPSNIKQQARPTAKAARPAPVPAKPRKASPAAPPIEKPEGALPIDAAVRRRMKADVQRLLGEHRQPNAAQWKMIFSDAPATCVVAGAGAGKSASLVLRVVLLVEYLAVPLEQVSVVTFTRESRKDFIARLIETFALWGRTLSERQARDRVRTFHSRALGWAQAQPALAGLKAFEALGQGGAGDPDQPPFALALNNQQRDLLGQAYSALLEGDAHFAESIDTLRRQALQLERLGRDHPDVRTRATVMGLAAQRDSALTEQVRALWQAAGAWPLPGVEAATSALELRGHAFHVHGWHAGAQAWVVLGVDPRESRDLRRAQGELPLAAEVAVKRTLFQAFCDQPVIWLGSYSEGQALAKRMAGDAGRGPGLEYRLVGEHRAQPLLELFYQVASFIESLGLDVADAIARAGLAEQGADAPFFQALARFWPACTARWRQASPPVMPYNHIFSHFISQGFDGIEDPAIDVFRHLLVDEFQDVSALLVAWLKAVLAERERRGLAGGSLLCVGDDWQSIYGWRGSSPSFFLDFEQVFQASAHSRVMLRDNYRCQQGVIDAAEWVVKATPSLKGKKARAVGERPVAPVQVLARDDASLLAKVQAHIEADETVLVLYRRAMDKPELEKLLKPVLERCKASGKPERLRLMTYHAAKGLEADAVCLMGDCIYQGGGQWRNAVYRLAGFGPAGAEQPYDAAQAEEAYRLAYVAITRARQHCYWFIEPGGQAVLAKASSRVAGSKGLFVDSRGLESSATGA